ncbi:hypothetical protein [Streptomyces viridochromogenes]|uniref:Secreted protein n=1 Tax=Streptomyces viridochromogenes Tue57 TaxID=1160705 RepID=L8PJZ9_STRVR|nr:hypothetical protein [Streptomyces viridochromogenes]ELS55677.1 hypothetical protein STVIR_3354 [Streptomyces viridochromogenes Tue57]
MRKRITTALGAAAAAIMLTTTTASAAGSDDIISDEPGFFHYERSCGTSYAMTLTTKKAIAAKGNDGRCAGHVWLRMYGNAWGDWSHDDTSVTRTSPNGTFKKALIKGCADCHAYTVYPG